MNFTMSHYWAHLELLPYVGYWQQSGSDEAFISFGWLWWEFCFYFSTAKRKEGLGRGNGTWFIIYPYIFTTPKLHIGFPHFVKFTRRKTGWDFDFQILNIGFHYS